MLLVPRSARGPAGALRREAPAPRAPGHEQQLPEHHGLDHLEVALSQLADLTVSTATQSRGDGRREHSPSHPRLETGQPEGQTSMVLGDRCGTGQEGRAQLLERAGCSLPGRGKLSTSPPVAGWGAGLFGVPLPNSRGILQSPSAHENLSLWRPCIIVNTVTNNSQLSYLGVRRLRRDSQGSLPLVLTTSRFWRFPLLSYCSCSIFLARATCHPGSTHSPGQLRCPRGLALVQRPVLGARRLHQVLQELQRTAELRELGQHPAGPADGQTDRAGSDPRGDGACQCIPIAPPGKTNSLL